MRDARHCPAAADHRGGLTIANAALAAEETTHETTAPRVDVIGTPEQLSEIAGTATILAPQELENARVFTTTEACARRPGSTYVTRRLRPAPEHRHPRAQSLALDQSVAARGRHSAFLRALRDNASYYHPPIDRFERIEILKGSEQIRFGPQTAGGVVNYITPVPSGAPAGKSASPSQPRLFQRTPATRTWPGASGLCAQAGEGSRDNTTRSSTT